MDGVSIMIQSKDRGMFMKRMQGLTLIETMVAITISLILLSGAITLFINNKVTYETNDNLSRLQENARFAIEFLIDDLRMAGYFGCRNLTVIEDPPGTFKTESHENNIITGPAGFGDLEDIVNPLEGLNDKENGFEWEPSDNTQDVDANILDGTDAVTIRHLSGTNLVETANTAGQFTLEDVTGIAVDDLVAVSHCGGADLFPVTGVSAGTDQISHPTLSREYDSNGDVDDPANPIVSTFVAVRYYVGTDADGNPALFREVLGTGVDPVSDHQQLIEGVESMHILYGLDTTNNNIPDTYVPADHAALNPLTAGAAMAAWSNVVAVRLALLMRTNRPYGDANDAVTDGNGKIVYQLNDATFTVPDDVINVPDDDTARRYKRRVFTTTVLLRNRLT